MFASKVLRLFFGNVAGAAIGFAVSALLARSLSVESFGKVGLILAFSTIVSTIGEFGFGQSVLILTGKFKTDFSRDQIIDSMSKIFAIVALIAVICSGFFFPELGSESPLLRGAEIASGVLLALALAMQRFAVGVLQADARWTASSVLAVQSSTLRLACVAAAIYVVCPWMFGFPIAARYLFALGGFCTFGVLFPVWAIFVADLKFNRPLRRDVFRLGQEIILSTGLTNLAIVIAMRVDAFIIESKLGAAALGTWTAANTLAMVIPLLTSALLAVRIRGVAHGESAANQGGRYQLALIILLCFGCWLLGQTFIEISFGERYAKAALIFKPLACVYALGIYFTPKEALISVHRPSRTLILKIFQSLIVALGGVLLVNYFGLFGMLYAIALSRILGWALLVKWERELRMGIC